MALYTNGHKVCINLSKINLLSVSLPSQTNTGNWTLINANKVGNSTFGTSAGQVGLMFTDQSSSKLNAQQAGITYIKTPTGGFSLSGVWGKQTGNIYAYNVESMKKITSPSAGNTYYLVSEINDQEKYVIGLYDGQINLEPFVLSTTYDNHFKWTIISKNPGYDLKNVSGNSYAVVNDDGSISVQNTSPLGYFSASAGYFQYANGVKTWIPYYVSSSSIKISDDSNTYDAFLYSFSRILFTITLTRVTDSTQLAGKQLVLAIRDSNGRYYLVGLNSSYALTMFDTGETTTSNGNIIFSSLNNNSYFSQFYINVSSYNSGYLLQFNYNTKYYLTPPSGTLSSSLSFTRSTTKRAVSYNSTVGVHLSAASLGNFGITSVTQKVATTTMAANAGTTVVFRKNGSTWTPYYGSLNTGDTYAIAVRKAPTDENHPGDNTASYYLVGTTKKYTWASTAATYLNTGIITSSGETLYTNAICTLIENTDHFYITVDGLYLDVKNYRLFTTPNQPTGEFYLGNNNELKYSYYVSTNTNGTITSQLVETSFGISEVSLSLIAHEFATLNDIVVTEDAECTAYEGVYGAGLFYGNQGLNIRDNNLSLETTSLEWYYIPNEQPPDDSRLWSVDERIDYRCALYTNNHRV